MSLLEKQLAAGKVHAMLPQWRRLVEESREAVRGMLALHPRSYVALSWGKQSIVLAHMVRGIDPGIPAVHCTGPDAELIGNFTAVRDEFLSRWPIPYVELERGNGTDALRDAVGPWVEEHGMTGVFIGLCAYESRGRMQAVRAAGRDLILDTARPVRCYPLGRWTQHDLAAYIATHGLPMLMPYHRFGLEARTSTGSRPGYFTERALDLMNSTRAAEMRRRWSER